MSYFYFYENHDCVGFISSLTAVSESSDGRALGAETATCLKSPLPTRIHLILPPIPTGLPTYLFPMVIPSALPSRPKPHPRRRPALTSCHLSHPRILSTLAPLPPGLHLPSLLIPYLKKW